ncbi:Uncharacterised protein [Mycobacteroides abscessus subsp. massiliense]|nr:Uncharacterised protein [Mycobacteroides abscessus subsp. massiliense]
MLPENRGYRLHRPVVYDGDREGMHRCHRRFFIGTGGYRLGLRDPRDGGQRLLSHLFIEGTHVDAELRIVGNDVVLRTRMHIADGHHCGLERRQLARDDRL